MNRSFRGRSADRGSGSYNIGRPIISHGQDFRTEKDRMSVFDRLGSRGGFSSGSGGSGTNYADYSQGRRPLASSVVPVRRHPPEDERMTHQSQGSRYEEEKYSNYTSRTRSKSPSYKSRTEGLMESRRHGQMEHGSMPKSKHKDIRTKEGHKSKKKGHSTSKSKKIPKQKRKANGSSSDSSSKGGTSSTSKSESSSSSVSDASDSSHTDSDSSESSAPSIKLKTGKSKRTTGNQPDKERRQKEIAVSKGTFGSSSSSIMSTPTKHEGLKIRGVERSNSPYIRDKEREYTKDRDYDRRSNLSLKTRDARDIPHSYGSVEDRPHYSRQPPVDLPSRKRQNSVESYGSAGKRSRRYTPTPDGYKSTSRHSPGARRIPSPESVHEKRRYAPEPSRRMTPPGGYVEKMRRERSRPPSSGPEKIRIISSKHSYYEDNHRREDRYDDRPPRDLRGRQYDAPGDERRPPRERLAPARTSPPMRGRPAPPQSYDSPGPGRRAPLLPFPAGVETHSRGFGYQQGASPQRRDFVSSAAGPGNAPSQVRKQGLPILRTNEFERGGRQARVDSWVDDTLTKDSNRPALLPTPTAYAPYTHPPAIRTEVAATGPATATENSGKLIETSSVEPESSEKKTESGTKPEMDLEEVLSDFSDDAEEILNEAPPGTENQHNELPDTIETKKEELGQDRFIETETEDTKANVSRTSTNNHAPNEADVLDEFDLEEISDDELGDPERKTGMVDALGVDWSSLISTQKVKSEPPQENAEEKKVSLRERWCPANRFKSSGLPRGLFGETFFNKVYREVQLEEEKYGVKPEERTTKEELEFPSLRLNRLARCDLVKKIGIMSSYTAYTRHRDETLRRAMLHRPQAPIGGFLEVPQTSVEEDEESDANIFRKCVALLKETTVV